jgi:hypothetical protein
MLRKGRATAALAAVVLSAAACSAQPPSNPPDGSTPTTVASSPTPGPSSSSLPTSGTGTATGSVDTGQVDVRTSAGYTYRLTYRYGAVGPGRNQVENAPPGKTDVFFPVTQGSIMVANTTANRNAPGLGVLGMAGLYEVGRPSCEQHDYTQYTVRAGGNEKLYCMIYISILEPPNIGPLTIGQTQNYVANAQTAVNNVHYLGIPEGNANALIADMAAGPDIKVFGSIDRPLSAPLDLDPPTACYLSPAGRADPIHVLESRPLAVEACDSSR